MKFILIVASCYFIMGCAVDSKEWKIAEEKCAANGGVKYFQIESIFKARGVVCNNEASFNIK